MKFPLSASNPWAYRLGHLLVGLVFLISGLAKGMHSEGFAAMLGNRFLWFPSALAMPATTLLFLLELILAAMLVSHYYLSFARLAATLLLMVFILFLTISLIAGVTLECSCYGALVSVEPVWMILHDSVLVFLLGLLDRAGTDLVPRRRHHITFSIVLALFLGLAVYGARSTTFDPFLLKLKPGFVMDNLPTLHGDAPNGSEKRLVVITDDLSGLDRIQAHQAERYPDHKLVILVPQLPEPRPAGTTPIMVMKGSLIPHFYHHLPTSFTIEDRMVQQVWYGRLPW